MDDRELSRIARIIVWDYRYDPEDVADVLRGRRESGVLSTLAAREAPFI